MLYLFRLRPKLNDEFHRLKKKELAMPFVIEKTKDPLYKEGLYDGLHLFRRCASPMNKLVKLWAMYGF